MALCTCPESTNVCSWCPQGATVMPGLLGDPCPVLTLPARSPLPSTVSSWLIEGGGDCTSCTSHEQGQGGGHAVRTEELRDAAGNLGAVHCELLPPVTVRHFPLRWWERERTDQRLSCPSSLSDKGADI